MNRRWLSAALSIMAGCSGDALGPTACATPIVASVGGGTVPVFTWTPACGISLISVVPFPNPTPLSMWSIDGGKRTFGPPVTYGSGGSSARPLVVGQVYEATFSVYAEVPGSSPGVTFDGDTVLTRMQFTP